ncbi:MAG: M23 family metallopeptidase [Anaerolineae bacterium]|nr:M23 family metallopeptidase [Anaerolineae bacterium]
MDTKFSVQRRWMGMLLAFLLLASMPGIASAGPGPTSRLYTPPVQPLVDDPTIFADPAELKSLSREYAADPVHSWDLLRPEVITYTVQTGDSDWSIAQQFGLDIDTLRYSNEWMRLNPDLIHPGSEMVILPVIGAYTAVEAGDTLESIALRYGVDPAEIRNFPLNKIDGSTLRVGQKLVIPDGRLDYAERILPPGPGRGYALAWPMRGIVSQGYHAGHLAIDIASYYGAKVYASAGGRVVYARFSPDGWLGFRVVISHGNGLQTAYNHMSDIYVEEGETVSRGQMIGQVGSTGNSTGPHVHFQVYSGSVRANPLNYLPPSPAG